MATMVDVGDHLDVSVETVRQLKKRGVLHGAARGTMNLDESRVAYIRHLREQAAGRSSDEADAEGLDIVRERARLARENADAKAMANALARRELVPIADVTAAVVGLIELSKVKLQRLAARIGGSDAALKARVRDLVEEALEELSLARVEEAVDGTGGEGEEEDG